MNASEIFDIISSTINTMFSNIFSSIDNNLYSTLDDFTFINPNILTSSKLPDMFGLSHNNGILIIANSLILGYLIYYSFKLIFSYIGITNVENPSHFLFKLIIYSICMNFSLFICNEIIYIVALISSSIRQVGENIFNIEICFSSLITQLNPILYTDTSLDIFSLDGILKIIISTGLLNLVISYSIRFVLVKVFVLLSPFTFLSLCNKSTSILFKSWLKSFLSLLFIQIFVSVVLLFIFSLNISSNRLSAKFILIGSILILIKANNYVKEMLGGISTDVGISLNNFKSMIMK